jgi:hypothetical protein
MSRRKLPAALLFTEDGEQQWRRHVRAREIRAAVAEVNKHSKGNARIPGDARCCRCDSNPAYGSH